MTDRLDGPQATGGGESAAGASSGPRETPADPSTDSPQPGAALSDSGADAPATSDSLTVSESPTDDSPTDSPIDSDEPPAGPAAAGYATAAPPGAVATAGA
ncbi:hypothetical protein, partial [Microbispora rosea]